MAGEVTPCSPTVGAADAASSPPATAGKASFEQTVFEQAPKLFVPGVVIYLEPVVDPSSAQPTSYRMCTGGCISSQDKYFVGERRAEWIVFPPGYLTQPSPPAPFSRTVVPLVGEVPPALTFLYAACTPSLGSVRLDPSSDPTPPEPPDESEVTNEASPPPDTPNQTPWGVAFFSRYANSSASTSSSSSSSSSLRLRGLAMARPVDSPPPTPPSVTPGCADSPHHRAARLLQAPPFSLLASPSIPRLSSAIPPRACLGREGCLPVYDASSCQGPAHCAPPVFVLDDDPDSGPSAEALPPPTPHLRPAASPAASAVITHGAHTSPTLPPKPQAAAAEKQASKSSTPLLGRSSPLYSRPPPSPGLRATCPDRTLRGGPFVATVVDPACLAEIVLSRDALESHMPYRYEAALRHVIGRAD